MGLLVEALIGSVIGCLMIWVIFEILLYRGPPRDTPFPVIGHLLHLLQYTRHYAFHEFVGDLSRRYGNIASFTLFGTTFATITKASEAKRLLTNTIDFGRGDFMQFMFSGIIHYGLFLLPTNGSLWKKHRKWIHPAFGPGNVRLTLEAANQVMDRVEALLDLQMNSSKEKHGLFQNLNVFHFASLITLDVIGRIAFSKDLGNVETLQSEKVTEKVVLTGYIAMIVEKRFAYPAFLWPILGLSDKAAQSAIKPVDSFLKQLLHERKEAGSVSKDPTKSDMIDRLLSTAADGTDVFTDQEIAEELLSFFFAGHETTGNMLTCIIRRICEAPDVYAKLEAAVQELDPRSWDDIHACKYLDWTVKEGLRLDPTAAVLGRINLRPVEVLGYTFTRRTEFTIDVLSLHRDPRYFTDPLTFNPERWDNGFTPEPGSYLPFGDGPAVCIGQKIAVLELKVVLCRLLQKYRLDLVPGQDLRLVSTLTTGLKNGLLVNLHHLDSIQ